MPVSIAVIDFLHAYTYTEMWAWEIYPVIQTDYEELMLMTTLRMKERHDKLLEHRGKKDRQGGEGEGEEGTQGRRGGRSAQILSVMVVVEVKPEKRNTYMSLAWTEPGDNTSLQQQVSPSNTSKQRDTHLHQ